MQPEEITLARAGWTSPGSPAYREFRPLASDVQLDLDALRCLAWTRSHATLNVRFESPFLPFRILQTGKLSSGNSLIASVHAPALHNHFAFKAIAIVISADSRRVPAVDVTRLNRIFGRRILPCLAARPSPLSLKLQPGGGCYGVQLRTTAAAARKSSG